MPSGNKALTEPMLTMLPYVTRPQRIRPFQNTTANEERSDYTLSFLLAQSRMIWLTTVDKKLDHLFPDWLNHQQIPKSDRRIMIGGWNTTPVSHYNTEESLELPIASVESCQGDGSVRGLINQHVSLTHATYGRFYSLRQILTGDGLFLVCLCFAKSFGGHISHWARHHWSQSDD